MRAAVCAAIVVAWGVTASPGALADDLKAAKRSYRRAERAYAAKDYPRALRLYLDAYQNKPLPGFLFNIAQCYRGLGRYDQAIEHFTAYLRRSKNRANRRTARGLLAECKRKRNLQRGAASTAGSPGVVVRSHDSGGSITTGGPGVDGEVPPRALRSAGAADSRDGRAGLSPLYFWTAVGVTAAASLTTLATGIVALKLSSEFNDPATPQADLQSTSDRGKAMATTANVMFALTLVSAAATAGLFFFTDFSPKGDPGRVALGVDSHGARIALQGRF